VLECEQDQEPQIDREGSGDRASAGIVELCRGKEAADESDGIQHRNMEQRVREHTVRHDQDAAHHVKSPYEMMGAWSSHGPNLKMPGIFGIRPSVRARLKSILAAQALGELALPCGKHARLSGLIVRDQFTTLRIDLRSTASRRLKFEEFSLDCSSHHAWLSRDGLVG
jgi:hypothetical protein